MDHDKTYRFDQARHAAAIALKPEHIPDFQRLVKGLSVGCRFQFMVAEYNDAFYRREVIAQIDAVLAGTGQRAVQLTLAAEDHADFGALEADLTRLAVNHQAIHVLGGENWFTDSRWQAFNIRREAVAKSVPLCLIFWLSTVQINRLALMAPDLWAWRSGVFSFATPDAPLHVAPAARRDPVDARTLAERSKRIAELRNYLEAEPPYPDEIRLPLLDEMANLYLSIGKIDEALRIHRELELPVYEKLGNVRAAAVTQGKIADILQARGQLDEALQIYREIELPIYEKLGDMRLTALAQGRIADVLQSRGQFDDALRIRRQIELPLFKQLDEVREIAVTQGKIADILQIRGQLEEALRSRIELELPIFEKLGDLREVAITQSKIADILQIRGQLEEALRSRIELELPIFEKLGDLREVAITQSKIADIWQARDRSDEALRIYRQLVLPVLEKLGEARTVAFVRGKITDILRLRANPHP